MTSSICSVGSPGFRSVSALITIAPISSGRTLFKAPLYFPIGVLTASTITTSLIFPPALHFLYSRTHLYQTCGLAFPLLHTVQEVAPDGIFHQVFHVNILDYLNGHLA